VEIESNAELILAWHLGCRSVHDPRLFAKNCYATLFADGTNGIGLRACIFHELPS
jgi:hypothetical protein